MPGTVQEALDLARSQIGVKESPAGSNRQPYGRWYGWDGVAWCSIFGSYIVFHSGASGYRYARVATSVSEAKRRGQWHSVPKPGDMACILYSGASGPGHTGMVENVYPDGTCDTIEGNTSPTSDADGGMVMRRRRRISFWNAGFVRPKYVQAAQFRDVIGADISHHQGDLRVSVVRQAGNEFLWHKATEGGVFVDKQYDNKRKQAAEIGMPFGAYDFARPDVDPVKHADHFFDHAGIHGQGNLRPMMDLEVPGLTPHWVSRYRARIEQRFGVVPAAYIATFLYQTSGMPSAIGGCPKVVPRYSVTPPAIPWDVWQFTDARPCPGTPGIDGNITKRLDLIIIGANPLEDELTPAQAALLDDLLRERNPEPGMNAPVVGMDACPTGGYWQVMSDGGVANFGGAGFYGSLGGIKLNSPILGIRSTPSGKGYWLYADDGIFAFGDAVYYGRVGDLPKNT